MKKTTGEKKVGFYLVIACWFTGLYLVGLEWYMDYP